MDARFFVPYETAQQLKEKGYPQESDSFQECDMYYYDDGELEAGIAVDMDDLEDCIYAPTYHEVLDWLEGKGYPIESACVREYSDSDWMWICCVAYINATKPHFTHEEALNAAILKALKKL